MRTERRNKEYGGTQIFDHISDAKWASKPLTDGYGQWWTLGDTDSQALLIEEQERLWGLSNPMV